MSKVKNAEAKNKAAPYAAAAPITDSSDIEKLEFTDAKAQKDVSEVDSESAAAREGNDAVISDRYSFPKFLRVSPSPHIKSSDTTSKIMLDVFISLIPAFIWGVFVFGPRALVIGALSVASAVLFEYLFCRVRKKKSTVGDLSAAVTGLLLAMNLSSTVPYWIPVVGSFFAVVVVKGLFGGLGKNIVNPALAARVFLFAWPSEMNTFVAPGVHAGIISGSADITASATPLSQIKMDGTLSASLYDLIIGNVGGCIGEVSALFLMIGGAYLLIRRVITWHIPVSYIGTVALIALIFPRLEGDLLNNVLTEIFSGGVIICAFFMATDYVTSPITAKGKLIFGAGCGIITMLIRYFGGYSEGASFSVLIMNLLVWYIDKLTMPKHFGVKGGKASVKEK